MRDADLAGERRESGVAVQELALRGTAGEGLKFVLAVDIDEDVARLAQQLHRDRLAVEVSARAPIRAHHAPHDEVATGADRLLLEPLLELAWRATEVEGAGDLGALGAVTHHFGPGAAAGEQLQRIDEDRLAGTGLTGQHGESGAQFELHGIDDGEVTDLQVGQHGF